MVDDLSDIHAELRALKNKVRRLELSNPLQNASISEGGLRIIGGEVVVEGPVPIRLRQGNVGGVDQAMLQFDGTSTAIYANSAGGNVNLVIQAGAAILQLNDNGVHIINAEMLPANTDAEYAVIDANGKIWRSPGMGGGGGDPTPGTDLGNFQWPFPLDTVTSEYGPRSGRIHEGIDFGLAPAVAGAPIIAAGDGVVAVRTYSSGWGNYVRLTHTLDGGQQVSTLYAHMVEPAPVSVGQSVQKGDVIGHVGNTGNSFGAHLHFETWMTTTYGSHVDPRTFMAAYGPE